MVKRKLIKKVSVSPIPPINGSVVDTFNVEDKTTNAPSVNAVKNFILSTKPIGTIEFNTSGVNPSEYIGGTWVAWGSGRVPVGLNTTDVNFDTPEKIGGEAWHVLTIDEMPSHTHRYVEYSGELTTTNAIEGVGIVSQKNPFEANTYSTGGNFAHNNLQPFITCYMWKRTA